MKPALSKKVVVAAVLGNAMELGLCLRRAMPETLDQRPATGA